MRTSAAGAGSASTAPASMAVDGGEDGGGSNRKLKWWEKVKGQVEATLDGVIAGEPKKGKGANGEVLGAMGPAPFESRQSEWLQQLIVKQTAWLGEAFDDRIEEVSAEVSAIKTELQVVRQSQSSFATKEVMLDETRRELCAMRKDIVEELHQELLTASPSNPAPGSPARSMNSSMSSASAGIPWERRTIATMGNLGWDQTELGVQARAKEALQKAQIEDKDWHTLSPLFRRGGRGSLVELHFVSAEALQMAIGKFRATEIKFVEGQCKDPVWLNIKKTQAERLPGRKLKLLHQMLNEQIDKSAGVWHEDTISMNHRVRAVSVRGIKAAYIDRDGDVRLTAAADAMLSKEDADLIVNVVSQLH